MIEITNQPTDIPMKEAVAKGLKPRLFPLANIPAKEGAAKGTEKKGTTKTRSKPFKVQRRRGTQNTPHALSVLSAWPVWQSFSTTLSTTNCDLLPGHSLCRNPR